MKTWEKPLVVELDFTETLFGGKEFTTVDRTYKDSNGQTVGDFS